MYCGLGDHPRSRGVYKSSTVTLDAMFGSSPLARGLLDVVRAFEVGAGIIPARAGFTPSGSRPRPGAPDHPRSRGVYESGVRARLYRGGSSPLARGLRDPRRLRRDDAGIIPARAGFTQDCGGPGAPGRDHPRSRGVYLASLPISVDDRGSSPLARGLPGVPADQRGRPRIIPARAGFTLPSP